MSDRPVWPIHQQVMSVGMFLLTGALFLLAWTWAHNPVDQLTVGKWVRHWQTGTGTHTATLCLSAETQAEVPAQRAELPSAISALTAAGAVAIGIDLPDPSDAEAAAVRAAAGSVPVIWEGAVTKMERGLLDMSVGMKGQRSKRWPLSLETLAARDGGEVQWRPDAHLVAGRQVPAEEPFAYMPYLVPFLNWDDRSTWAEVAKGRIVFVGACKPDRELTRYGRQPGPVAHSELVETVLDGTFPWRAPKWLSLAVLVPFIFSGAYLRIRLKRRSYVGEAAISLMGMAFVLGCALGGIWMGFTGLVLCPFVGAWWACQFPELE